jgi:DNA (cytosine-5)-methyltransferase 1
MKKKVRVAELFAGVGGFRLGLESASNAYNVVWSNQWEPNKKNQFASDIYSKRFGKENHSNEDIATIQTSNLPEIDLLCGGFPCQDYSVARTLSQSSGLKGKKGVLWWEIHRILTDKKPEFLFLENVDRLLKSPAKQRGKDFAVMLASLSDLGYAIEWRVINAADYGMPQRRRRVFILGYSKDSKLYNKMIEKNNPSKWITEDGVLSKAFKIKGESGKLNNFMIEGDLPDISEKFGISAKESAFKNTGLIVKGQVWTADVHPDYNGERTTLGEILIPESKVPEEFFVDSNSLEKWNYLKGAKNEVRVNKANGVEYRYAEGSMIFPDSTDRPSRTIVTGEGGTSASRFKHVIKTKSGRLRRLTPIELERLNMFPDNHTKEGSDVQRAFLMGNALVVGVIKKIGESLATEL